MTTTTADGGFVHKMIRNAWYVCATSDQVGQGLLARTLLGQPVVLYRTSSGKAVAMHDACPHRYMPLSKGRPYKDGIRCMYHGALYDQTGQCVEVPSQHDVPPKCAAKVYPTIEVKPWIWIWMGDPAKADPKLLPDQRFNGMGAEGFRSVQMKYRVAKGRYHLCNENLIDDTHITFLHMGQFESGGRVHTPPETSQEGSWIRTRWFDPKERISNYFRMEFDVDYTVAPRALVGHFHPPATHGIWIEVYDPANPSGPPRTLRISFCYTPETGNSTHMFVVESRNYRQQDPEWDAFMTETFWVIQGQDLDAIEAIEQRLASGCDLPEEVSFRADASVIRARRVMQQMLREESR